jgi:histidinol-phosphate aminotransferase
VAQVAETPTVAASPAAVAALHTGVDLSTRPDPHSATLRAALADRYDIPADAFLVGPGAAALLHGTVARHAALRPTVPLVYSQPSFELYQQLAIHYRLPATPIPLAGHRHDRAAIADAVATTPGLVLLDSPHNITGTPIAVADSLALVRHAAAGTVVVHDNVYGEYQDNDLDPDLRAAVHSGLPLIIARSLSKAHQLFGLRVGYLIGDPAVLATYGPVVLRYDVGTLAQRGAAASIRDRHSIDRNRQLVAATRRELRTMLDAAGLPASNSQSDSILVDAGPVGPKLAGALHAVGVQVRGPQRHHIAGHLQIMIDGPGTAGLVQQALRHIQEDSWT